MCRPSRSARDALFLHNRAAALELFHYHLVTSNVREVEARYLGKLGFGLIARYGRIGEDQVHFEAGVSWEDLERRGFRHRLSAAAVRHPTARRAHGSAPGLGTRQPGAVPVAARPETQSGFALALHDL